jgi:hypothetical protein
MRDGGALFCGISESRRGLADESGKTGIVRRASVQLRDIYDNLVKK